MATPYSQRLAKLFDQLQIKPGGWMGEFCLLLVAKQESMGFCDVLCLPACTAPCLRQAGSD